MQMLLALITWLLAAKEWKRLLQSKVVNFRLLSSPGFCPEFAMWRVKLQVCLPSLGSEASSLDFKLFLSPKSGRQACVCCAESWVSHNQTGIPPATNCSKLAVASIASFLIFRLHPDVNTTSLWSKACCLWLLSVTSRQVILVLEHRAV